MSKCRSCGQEIAWIELKSGKRMPVDLPPIDPKEVKHGETLISDDGRVVTTGMGIVLNDFQDYYRSHFSSCPHADDWRSRPESKAKRSIKEEAAKQKAAQWK